MMHEARTDFSMWLGLLFLLIVGAGRWSFDAALMRGEDQVSMGRAHRDNKRKKNRFCECPELIVKGKRISPSTASRLRTWFFH